MGEWCSSELVRHFSGEDAAAVEVHVPIEDFLAAGDIYAGGWHGPVVKGMI